MFSSKKEKRLAKSTVTDITKSGYLTKRSKVSGYNWKRRYFVLNGNTLTYFLDHRNTDVPKGDVLLTDDTVVHDFQDPAHLFGFTVKTPFVQLLCAAKDTQDREDWKCKIRTAISRLEGGIRGDLWKEGKFLEKKVVKKFFMLHSDCLTYHKSLHHTSTIEGMRKFSGKTTIIKDPNSDTTLILKTNLTDGKPWNLQTGTVEERNMWVDGLVDAVSKLGLMAVDYQDVSAEVHVKDCIKQGCLNVRPSKGGVDWVEGFFVLSDSKLFQYHDRGSSKPVQMMVLSPNCSVFETKLMDFSFELVTNTKVLHVQGKEDDDTSEWIDELRTAIGLSKQLEEDPLLESAKKQKSVFYDVTFSTKKPLGLVLERSGDWALVKLANQDTTHVSIGSALTTINDEDVTLSSYNDTIKKLTAWQPPLKLGFRVAPEKRGWLTKQGVGRRSQINKWKPRYFVLAEGRLSYFSDDGPTAVLKGVVHLMGSAISLVPRSESSLYFCFKVVSGITSISMQGITVDDMMSWGAAIYHAISVANGGGFLIDLEKKRLVDGNGLESKEAEEKEKTKVLDAKKVAAVFASEFAEKAKADEARSREVREEAEKEGQSETVESARMEERLRTKSSAAAQINASEAAAAGDVDSDDLESMATNTGTDTDTNTAAEMGMGMGIGRFSGYNEYEGGSDEEEEEHTAWQAYWNWDHNVWYYYHLETEETTWIRPEGEEITINQPEIDVDYEGEEGDDDDDDESEEAREEEGRRLFASPPRESRESESNSGLNIITAGLSSRRESRESRHSESVRKSSFVGSGGRGRGSISPMSPGSSSAVSTEEEELLDNPELADAPTVFKPGRRKSTVKVHPPVPPPRMEPPDNGGEEDDEGEGEGEGGNADDVDGGGDDDDDVTREEPLTVDEIKSIFATVDHGSVKGQLNPMLFATLIRAVTYSQNLYTEMSLFHKFNTNGDGVIDLEEFIDGVKVVEREEGLKSLFYKGLVKHLKSEKIIL